jgi:TRAP-type C4-dicarboxylate transport system permease small subunit
MVHGNSLPRHRGWRRRLHGLAAAFAIGGGIVLVAMTLLVVVSVTGRALVALPVPGDFEIVGIGTAVSIFLFLPYCYLERGNVAIDIFVKQMPPAVQRMMDVVAAALFAIVAALFAWRMTFGLIDTFRYEDVSMIIGFPLWSVYPIAVASFALLAISAAFTAAFGWDDAADE